VTRAAALALAAREVVDEGDAFSFVAFRDDLVPEHGPGGGAADLLYV
jgi:hypothetical protein